MKKQRSFVLTLFAAAIVACVPTTALSQAANDKFANVISGGSSVRWEVSASNAGVTLTISAPDGRVFTKDFKSNTPAEFMLTDKQGDRLPDGTYTYELRLALVISAATKSALKASRAPDDEPEADRVGRKRAGLQTMVQSGSFSILNGQVIVAGAVEGQRSNTKVTERPRASQPSSGNTMARLRNHRFSLGVIPDQVIPDDLIVQGSACVGLDCVNNENFGFDTIRLKENNDRLQFDDTSTAAGFPTNNWQIRANSSASGGASFLAFVDQGSGGNSESGTILFEVDAGAPANSIKVSSSGKVGFRTATPVLDLHMNTSDTPAVRFEQNSGGGFTAQTWDVAGNEANFFVRDVTGGSRLPFRIRPGAPTSSIDISATGSVGIGTASPSQVLEVVSASDPRVLVRSSKGSSDNATVAIRPTAGGSGRVDFQNGAGTVRALVGSNEGLDNLLFFTGGLNERMRIESSGNVGIATTAPTATLSVNGTANKPGGGSWDIFSDERLKNIRGRFNSGLKALMQLQPIRYQYKPDNALGLKSEGEHVGFGAQALQKIIPEAVTENSAGYLMVNNDPILWTMLNAIKEQQQQIVQLRQQVRRLQAASHRRRR